MNPAQRAAACARLHTCIAAAAADSVPGHAFPSPDALVSLLATLSQAESGHGGSAGSCDSATSTLAAALLRAAGDQQVAADEAAAAAKPQALRVGAPGRVAPLLQCLQVCAGVSTPAHVQMPQCQIICPIQQLG